MEQYGIWSLLPVAVVILLVFTTRQTAASLIAGSLVGAVMLYGINFVDPWLDVLYGVLGSDLYIWIVLISGFLGSLVALFEASGGIRAFTRLAERWCKNRKSTLFATWLMGFLVFVDDWFSILAIGSAMRSCTDRYGIPREMLAFTVNLNATSICVMVPVSSWGVFMIAQMVSTGVCTSANGFGVFASGIPLLFYPMLVILCNLLFGLELLPKFGPMKKVWADSSCQIGAKEEESCEVKKKPRLLNFLLPVALITALTIGTGEILYGILLCLVFCAVLYLPQKLMTPKVYMETIMAGFKNMLGVLFIVAGAFTLRDINALLGMPEYVIGLAKTAMSPSLLPVIAFLIVAALAVAAGNFWGICAISFPVIIPVAQALHCDLLLASAAIISGTIAGAHICLFGSETTLACNVAEIENVQYAKTCIPLIMVPFCLSALGYLIIGFLWG